MDHYITITSQGQITIPAALRRKFGLYTSHKAIIRADEEKMIIEPAPDILSLRGVFKAKKRFSRAAERRAFEDAVAHEAT